MTKQRFLHSLRQYAAMERRSRTVSYVEQVETLVRLVDGVDVSGNRLLALAPGSVSWGRETADREFQANGNPTVAEVRKHRRSL